MALHVGLGVKAKRVALSGSARCQGNGSDIDVYAFGSLAAPLVCDVKARKTGEGFAMLERWLGDVDALFLSRDRAEPMVVLLWRICARVVKRSS